MGSLLKFMFFDTAEAGNDSWSDSYHVQEPAIDPVFAKGQNRHAEKGSWWKDTCLNG